MSHVRESCHFSIFWSFACKHGKTFKISVGVQLSASLLTHLCSTQGMVDWPVCYVTRCLDSLPATPCTFFPWMNTTVSSVYVQTTLCRGEIIDTPSNWWVSSGGQISVHHLEVSCLLPLLCSKRTIISSCCLYNPRYFWVTQLWWIVSIRLHWEPSTPNLNGKHPHLPPLFVCAKCQGLNILVSSSHCHCLLHVGQSGPVVW